MGQSLERNLCKQRTGGIGGADVEFGADMSCKERRRYHGKRGGSSSWNINGRDPTVIDCHGVVDCQQYEFYNVTWLRDQY